MNKSRSSQESNNSNELSSCDEISFHIHEASNQNIKLNLKIDNESMSYKSSFSDIVTWGNKKGILIDILIPIGGNSQIRKSKTITISYNIEGDHYTFESRYLETLEVGFTSIKIDIPTLIKTKKERNYVRVTPSSLQQIKVDLEDGIAGDVSNISKGGLCFLGPLGGRSIPSGKVFSKVSFFLPKEKLRIDTKGIVRHKEHAGLSWPQEKNKCGIEFIKAKQADIDAISEYVSSRQREKINN